MPRTLTLLLISGSLLGATALTACGGDGTGSTSYGAKRTKTPTHESASHESAKRAAAENGTAASKSAASGPVAATIEGFAFAPQQLKVKVGQEITWTNDDSAPHTVTAKSGAAFDSGTLAQGASYTWKATKAGTVAYFCAIHPSMVGTITVE